MTTPPLRAAIVGAGLMGSWHARYAARNRAQVVAIVDPDAGAANRLRAGFPAAAVFANLATMLAAAAPDVVHICTPVQTHAELAKAALERHTHVIVEKPLAVDAAQTRQLLDIADAAGMVLCPVYQFPFQHGFRRAEDWLRAHGPPLRVDLTICSAGAQRVGPGGGEQLVREILPHPISVICMLTGHDVVDPSGWTVASTVEGEFFASGGVGSVEASICISTRARPPRAEARVLSASGTLHLDFFHGYSVVQRARGGRIGKIMLPFEGAVVQSGGAARNLLRRTLAREPAYPGLATLIGAFFAAARQTGSPPFSRTLIEAIAGWCDFLEIRGSHEAPTRRIDVSQG
ncbi:MAG: Gfo/Idh/MocA family oxidoreductase [Betaproteobacteria bacterium]